jgi:hypothetical protein
MGPAPSRDQVKRRAARNVRGPVRTDRLSPEGNAVTCKSETAARIVGHAFGPCMRLHGQASPTAAPDEENARTETPPASAQPSVFGGFPRRVFSQEINSNNVRAGIFDGRPALTWKTLSGWRCPGSRHRETPVSGHRKPVCRVIGNTGRMITVGDVDRPSRHHRCCRRGPRAGRRRPLPRGIQELGFQARGPLPGRRRSSVHPTLTAPQDLPERHQPAGRRADRDGPQTAHRARPGPPGPTRSAGICRTHTR